MQEKQKLPCPNCNDTNTRKDGCSSVGKQVYECRDCRRVWVFGAYRGAGKRYQEVQLQAKLNHKTRETCPRCNSSCTRKEGCYKGTQLYFCWICKRKWTSGKNYSLDSPRSISWVCEVRQRGCSLLASHQCVHCPRWFCLTFYPYHEVALPSHLTWPEYVGDHCEAAIIAASTL